MKFEILLGNCELGWNARWTRVSVVFANSYQMGHSKLGDSGIDQVIIELVMGAFLERFGPANNSVRANANTNPVQFPFSRVLQYPFAGWPGFLTCQDLDEFRCGTFILIPRKNAPALEEMNLVAVRLARIISKHQDVVSIGSKCVVSHLVHPQCVRIFETLSTIITYTTGCGKIAKVVRVQYSYATYQNLFDFHLHFFGSPGARTNSNVTCQCQ